MDHRVKLGIEYAGVAAALSAILWVSQDFEFSAWAHESDESNKPYNFTTIAGDDIKNNPLAQGV